MKIIHNISLLFVTLLFISCNQRTVIIEGKKLLARDSREYGIMLFDKFDAGEYHLYDVYQSKKDENLLLCQLWGEGDVKKWYKINSYNALWEVDSVLVNWEDFEKVNSIKFIR